jgi:hypothetical protein
MSAVTDALREAIEALDIDSVETEVDELRSALDSARTAVKDAATAIREARSQLTSVGARIRELAQADGPIDLDAVHLALDSLGGEDSTEYGPLEDLDTAADNLESAADDITRELGDAQQDERPTAIDGQAVTP